MYSSLFIVGIKFSSQNANANASNEFTYQKVTWLCPSFIYSLWGIVHLSIDIQILLNYYLENWR